MQQRQPHAHTTGKGRGSPKEGLATAIRAVARWSHRPTQPLPAHLHYRAAQIAGNDIARSLPIPHSSFEIGPTTGDITLKYLSEGPALRLRPRPCLLPPPGRAAVTARVSPAWLAACLASSVAGCLCGWLPVWPAGNSRQHPGRGGLAGVAISSRSAAGEYS